MMERLRYTLHVMRSGRYDWRALVGAVVGLAGAVAALAALEVDALPAALQPYAALIRELGRWALLVSTLAGVVVAQGKPALVRVPPASEPTILDDESDGEESGARVSW